MISPAENPNPMCIVGGKWVNCPPTPDEIEPLGVLTSLLLVPRWNGILGPTCNVAAHTYALLRWAELLRDRGDGRLGQGVAALDSEGFRALRRGLLLHDWHEAWTGDISGPVKRAARAVNGAETFGLDQLAKDIDAAVRSRMGFVPAPGTPADSLVHELDQAICFAEVTVWEMHPDLILRVLVKHGSPDPWAFVACAEAKRLAERNPDPIRRALDGDEYVGPLVGGLRLWLEDLFPDEGGRTWAADRCLRGSSL